MTQNRDAARLKAEQEMARLLRRQTGIAEETALSLIRDLGLDRNSLLREARLYLAKGPSEKV